MAERIANLQTSTAEKLVKIEELKEQLSTEAVKQWIGRSTRTQRGQFRHIAKFTHPVASTKSLLNKGSQFLRNRKYKSEDKS